MGSVCRAGTASGRRTLTCHSPRGGHCTRKSQCWHRAGGHCRDRCRLCRLGGVHVTNSTTVALTFLLIVLVPRRYRGCGSPSSHLFAAMLRSNFFFLPPVGTFTIADSHNWIALFAFLAVALVASNLSSLARARRRRHGSALRSRIRGDVCRGRTAFLSRVRVAAVQLVPLESRRAQGGAGP